jgi:hypothetical protein
MFKNQNEKYNDCYNGCVSFLRFISFKSQIKIMDNNVKDLKNKADNMNPEQKEGPVAAAIETYTAKLPSDLFLWAALGSMAVSATLKILKKDEEALFVGQWPAPFLLLGIYNKLVKQQGHDKTDRSGR